MGAGRVLCDDVLHRHMRTCVLSVSSTVSRSVCQSRYYVSALWYHGAETKKNDVMNLELSS